MSGVTSLKAATTIILYFSSVAGFVITHGFQQSDRETFGIKDLARENT